VKTSGQHVKPQSVLISFSGMDGSGKSTQILNLQDALLAAGIPVKNLAFWDHVAAFPGARANFSHKFLKSDGKVGTPERPAQRNDKNARTWYLTTARVLLYAVDAFKLRRVVKQAQANFDGVIIFDRYIYDQLATMSLDSPLARAYAHLVLKIVPRPDVAYVLDAVPEEARKRKPEYPLDFLHKYRRSYIQLQELAHLDLVPAMALEDVRTAILKKLERCIKLEAAEPHYSLESV
jgi:thymidylate kinase